MSHLSIAPKRRGNPNLGLAPRCGARTRGGCPCRAPAIRGRLRCRMHGGRSTGPRTEAGMARLRAARTVHGAYSAETRAFNRYTLMMLRRGWVSLDALRYRDRLPPELAARLMQSPPELMPPRYPSGGLTPAQDRTLLRAEAEALAPWKEAIGRAKAHALVAAGGREERRGWPACAGHDGKEGAGDAGPTTPCGASLAAPPKPHATERAGGASPTPSWPAQAGHPRLSSRPPAAVPNMASALPPKPHAPERAPAEAGAVPAGLRNRAERRRWMALQRRVDRVLAARPRP